MEIVTERLRLSPLDIDRDSADLHVAYVDPQVMAPWLGQPASIDLTDTRSRLAAQRDLDGARLWSLRRVGEETVLGLVELIGATDPPGVGWMLRRAAWGQGLMGEAAPALVAHLLEAAELERVEAWVDVANRASRRIAARCGMTERGRFARSYPDGSAHEVIVFGRSRQPGPQVLYRAEAVLPVRDVAATVEFLRRALSCEPSFLAGEPVHRAGIRVGPWSGTDGFQLVTVPYPEPITPVAQYLHCGVPARALYDRVKAAGGDVGDEPQARPWGRVEFAFQLPDGHQFVISGPS